jgi:hypothetical protein
VNAREIFGILGQVAAMLARLSWVLPRAAIHRRQGLRAFDRELKRLGLPADVRQVFFERYREALPLNPLTYFRQAPEAARRDAMGPRGHHSRHGQPRLQGHGRSPWRTGEKSGEQAGQRRAPTQADSARMV